MHFTIQREAFLKPLRAVASVVGKHTQATPVLLNVLIKIQDQQLSLTTTDQEVELVAKGRLEEPARENGMVTVPVRKLMEICRALPEGKQLSIVKEKDRVTLRSGRSRFALSTLPVNDFPSLSQNIGAIQFSIAKKPLRSLIEQTCFAMAEQDVRYYLNGMLLELKGNSLYGVAADGHRLAFAKAELGLEAPKAVRIIIPRKGVLELQRILQDAEEEIKVLVGDNHIRAITGDIQLTSKLLDGRFPDYERIVAAEGDKSFVGRRDVLKEVFQRAAALFNDKLRAVRLRLSKGQLKILATNSDQDEGEEDLEIEYNGDDLEIGFNIRYLIDFLNVITTEEVQFTFSNANSSGRIEGVGAKSGVYIIMPMQI